jgi:predicted HAD superfamily Cof-like phosphohydrolase
VTISLIQLWFKRAVPEPSNRNRNVQLGVHLEEVAEMLEALRGTDRESRLALDEALRAVSSLANGLKSMNLAVEVTNRVEFIDSVCDQIVTAAGCAHMHGMDADGALCEVNASNWSKFDADGKPVFDANGKIAKGPLYFKPNLTDFV